MRSFRVHVKSTIAEIEPQFEIGEQQQKEEVGTDPYPQQTGDGQLLALIDHGISVW
jgi:hypothetical protein